MGEWLKQFGEEERADIGGLDGECLQIAGVVGV